MMHNATINNQFGFFAYNSLSTPLIRFRTVSNANKKKDRILDTL
jgi:hypothetical protein